MDAREAIRALEEMLGSLRAQVSEEKPGKPGMGVEMDEEQVATFVRTNPLLQTKWSGSELEKYVLPPPVLPKWVWPWKGKYIDWRELVGREVTIRSSDGLGTTPALVLLVTVPDIWWWQRRCGDDVAVVLSVRGEPEPVKMRLSEFVHIIRSIETPLV